MKCARNRPQGDPVQDALVTQLSQMRLNSSKVLRGQQVEPLHDLRVAALRASFALKFFKGFIDSGHAGILRKELKYVRRVMAKRRDWDIFSSRIIKDFEVLDSPSLLQQKILVISENNKFRAHQELVNLLKSHRFEKLLRNLAKISTLQQKQFKPLNILKDLFKTVSHIHAVLSPAEIHQIRIAFKHLRYACEFLKVGDIKEIVRIQDILGENQDAKNTIKMLRSMNIKDKSREFIKLINLEKDSAHQSYKRFESIRHGQQYRKTLNTIAS